MLNSTVAHPTVTHPAVAHPTLAHPTLAHPIVAHPTIAHPLHPIVTNLHWMKGRFLNFVEEQNAALNHEAR